MMFNPKLFPLFVVFVLLAASGCSKDSSESPQVVLPQVRVQVAGLALSEVPFQVEVAGTLQAVEQALISSRVSGQVVEVPVEAGSSVKKGDLLVRISAAEISAQVLGAEAQASQARRNLERETKLQQANASTRETVNSLKEMVQIADAAYREARAMLDYTQIKAPFAGMVTHKMVEVGDLAAPGGPLLKLENGSALEVLVQIPESLVASLSLGERLQVSVPATGLRVAAAISEIAPTVDPLSRTTQVKLHLPEEPQLRSGQFARVSLPDKGASTLLVATSALDQVGQMTKVFVAEQNQARLRLVRTGAKYGEQVEILSGLQAGDKVIVAAEKRLQDGQPLEIVEGELTR
jgi:RND family efflux transporter MFP subunit